MPRRDLKFPDWLREARRSLVVQGPTALRTNIAEHLDKDQATKVLARLLQRADKELAQDIQTEEEGLDLIVQLIVFIDARDSIIEALDDDRSGR